MTAGCNCRKIDFILKCVLPLNPPAHKGQKVIEVNVNGVAQRFEPDTDIAALLERLRLAGKRVAVERNGEIVPRGRYAQTALANGDRLEIVVAVGGG